MNNTTNTTIATVNYSNLTVKELRALCKENNLTGYSHANKEVLISMLSSVAINNIEEATPMDSKASKNESLLVAREEAMDILGKDYKTAEMFYKDIHGTKKFTEWDYFRMTVEYKILSALLNNKAGEYSADKVAESLSRTFGDDVSSFSFEEKVDYINNKVELFDSKISTENLKKENYVILKVGFGAINANPDGRLFFDSSKKVTFTGEVTREMSSSAVREIATAEDGISRLLKDMVTGRGIPVKTISVSFEKPASMDEEQHSVIAKEIAMNGITDIATGEHFMFLKQGASESRQGECTFINVDTWDEVYPFWYKITGLGSYENFVKAFANKNGQFLLSKMLARISATGSNSFSAIAVYDDEHKTKVVNTKILFVDDPSILIKRRQLESSDTGLILNENGEVKLTPGDGQALFSNRYCAMNAGGMKIINGSKESRYLKLWDESGRNLEIAAKSPEFRRIDKDIPAVWQIRGGLEDMQSLKGTGVKAYFDNITVILTKELAESLTKMNGRTFTEGEELRLGDYDVICPKSVAKFMSDGDLSSKSFRLDICNFSKRKCEYVCLNPQFIASLSQENPNLLNGIAKDWVDFVDSTFDNDGNLFDFMKIIRHDEEEEESEALDVNKVLMSNRNLKDDPYIMGLLNKKRIKFLKEMRSGRIRVPGQYIYMQADPNALLNMWFGLGLPQLNAGEFYYKGLDCKAGLFRSPLIAPFEAQRVQLVEKELYFGYENCIIFNAVDGTWDLMGGADHDGDTCAVVPDNTAHGKIIVNAIRSNQTVVWEEAKSAQYVSWSPENNSELVKFISEIKRDQTGVITNYATRSLDIANSLYGIRYFAKLNGCEFVDFKDPRCYPNLEDDCKPQATDGVFATRGFMQFNKKKDGSLVAVKDNMIVGKFHVDSIQKLIDEKMGLVNQLRLYQGEEIDGAKTGFHPEIPETHQVKVTPSWMYSRKNPVDRASELMSDGMEYGSYNLSAYLDTMFDSYKQKVKRVNTFYSFSVMGRLFHYTWELSRPVFARMQQGTGKGSYFKSLLTQEELAQKDMTVNVGGNLMTFTQYIALQKSAYTKTVFNSSNKGFSEDERKVFLNDLKTREISKLYECASNLNIKPEVVALTAYLVTYDKTSKQNMGLSYGWLMWQELMKVFSRANEQYELISLPNGTETAYVEDGVLYADGRKVQKLDAANQSVLLSSYGVNRKFGLLHRVKADAVAERTVTVNAGASYVISVRGFGYANRAVSVEAFKEAVKANGYTFDIGLDDRKALCVFVNGQAQCQVSVEGTSTSNYDIELIGKRVKWVFNSELKFNNKSISGIKIEVI